MNDILLIDVLFSLALTVFAYLLVPIIYVIRRKVLTHKQIKKIIIINGAVVWVIFKMIILSTTGEASTSGAVFLWSAVGYSLLKKKCLEKTKKPDIQTETNTTINISFEGNIDQDKKEISSTPVIEQPLSDHCNQVPTTPKKSNRKTIAIVVLSVCVFALTVLNIYQYNSMKSLTIEDFLAQDETVVKSINYNKAIQNASYYETYYQLYLGIENKVRFYDENIVFVIEGYGNYYYTYDQMETVTQGLSSYSYWAYNKEQAQGLGYIPWK